MFIKILCVNLINCTCIYKVSVTIICSDTNNLDAYTGACSCMYMCLTVGERPLQLSETIVEGGALRWELVVGVVGVWVGVGGNARQLLLPGYRGYYLTS